MKLGDKLIELRKKNGYSQEELAEKLGVSRQSVSKWESNNTYPETDKIVQIANLFDCSMDDLINDKITDVESSLRKNKNSVTRIWNSFLEFIIKTVNMFSKMKFTEGLLCLVVMIVLALILLLFGNIVCKGTSTIIANIFSFLGNDISSTIREILKSIFFLIWFIVSVIVMIHTFKIKYLDKHDDIKVVTEKEKNNLKEEEKDKVVVVKENDQTFLFLDVLAKIVVFFIKFITAWIILGITFSTIGLIVGSIISLVYIPTNILFLWILLLLIASIAASILIIILLIKFIFNKKVNIKLSLIIFISCVVLSGISIGLIALSIKNIEIVNDNSAFNLTTEEITLDYQDNLLLNRTGVGYRETYKYIIDDTIEDNKIIVSRVMDKKYFKLFTTEKEYDKMPVITVHEESSFDIKLFYDFFLKNLKDNKIYTFENYGNDPLVIKANRYTINKLINNLKVVYLIDEEIIDNEINITTYQERVYFPNGLKGEYDAVSDTISYIEPNYSCRKEIVATSRGERTVYTCNYFEENEED